MITASSLMTQLPLTLSGRLTVREAAARLLSDHLHGAPVVDDDGRLVGVVSLTDLTRALLDFPVGDIPVSGVMTRMVRTIAPCDGVYEIADEMLRHDVHRLLVVDAERRPQGILTPMDVLRAMVNLGESFSARPDPAGRCSDREL